MRKIKQFVLNKERGHRLNITIKRKPEEEQKEGKKKKKRRKRKVYVFGVAS